jgi:hypothetical protein
MDPDFTFAKMFDRAEGVSNVDRIEAGQDLLEWLQRGGYVPERLQSASGGLVTDVELRGFAFGFVRVFIACLKRN